MWRAAGELGWQGSFSVYNLEDDELVGGLDITGSRGAVPRCSGGPSGAGQSEYPSYGRDLPRLSSSKICLLSVSEEFAEWSGGRGTHWPGRFFCVAPNRWQAERVWRAAGELGWQGSFSVYNLEDDELVGGLDITGSRGAVPPFIVEDLPPLRADVTRWLDFLATDPGSRRFRVSCAIEENPGAKSRYVSILTGINGAEVKAAFEKLSVEELSYGTTGGGSAPSNWLLAMAARRDRVWPGWPGKRFGERLVKSWSTQRWKRVASAQRLLSQFREGGCRAAAGWRARDGRFEPDGVVWLAAGPYGPGWHYLLCAARPKSEQSVRDFLKPCLSDERCDRYPILIVCSEEVEHFFWDLGGHLPMLTATVGRTRGLPLTGREGTPWMQYGAPVQVLTGKSHRYQPEE